MSRIMNLFRYIVVGEPKEPLETADRHSDLQVVWLYKSGGALAYLGSDSMIINLPSRKMSGY